MTVPELDRHLRALLIEPHSQLDAVDIAFNGIQVGRVGPDVNRVACAVDTSAETIARAAAWGADVLFVHHGLFWGSTRRLDGPLLHRVRQLLEADIGLYAIHLPLDVHPTLGNNAGMAATLELVNLKPLGDFRGVSVGWWGTVSEESHPDGLLLDEVVQPLFGSRERCLGVLPFGPHRIRTVGVVSGGAASDVTHAIAAGLDLYITGDASHQIYHECLEAGINVVFGGHYQTETWGPRLVCQHLADTAGLQCTFVDVPTGL